VPAGFVRIGLPADHPLRERGAEHILAPEGQEDEYRALVNGHVRRAEIERARQEADAAHQQRLQTEAALRAANEFVHTLFTDPRIVSTHLAIREEQGDEAAQVWLHGLMQQQGQNVQRYVEQAQAEFYQQQVQRQAQGFVADALPQAAARYPHWQEADVRRALASYGAYLEATGAEAMSLDEFYGHADTLYIRDPRVRPEIERFAQQKEQERLDALRREMAERERQELQRAAEARAANPMGRMPAAMHAGRTAPVETPRPQTVHEARRALTARPA
jgi:hypothetical protein